MIGDYSQTSHIEKTQSRQGAQPAHGHADKATKATCRLLEVDCTGMTLPLKAVVSLGGGWQPQYLAPNDAVAQAERAK